VEAASGGKVTILYDDKDNPSYMRRFSPMTNKDLYRQYFASDAAWNASPFKAIENEPHPAFMKGGTKIRELLIGQYLACELNGRACSLPGVDPRADLNYDQAVTLCKSKGAGWSLNTMYTWGFLQALCLRNKYQPRGNTNWGRSLEVPWETAPRNDNGLPGVKEGANPQNRTGTGPVSWNHDGTESGIVDLIGNAWEWQALMKLMDGKILLAPDNNIDLAESVWPDTGARYDSTGGTADGNGLGSSSNNLGAPVVSDAITKYNGAPGTNTYYGQSCLWGEAGFRSLTKKSDYSVPVALVQAGLAPVTLIGGAYEEGAALKGFIGTRNYGERLPLVGCDFGTDSSSGLGALYLPNPRSSKSRSHGLRPVFLLV
jgi:hypothetical protein